MLTLHIHMKCRCHKLTLHVTHCMLHVGIAYDCMLDFDIDYCKLTIYTICCMFHIQIPCWCCMTTFKVASWNLSCMLHVGNFLLTLMWHVAYWCVIVHVTCYMWRFITLHDNIACGCWSFFFHVDVAWCMLYVNIGLHVTYQTFLLLVYLACCILMVHCKCWMLHVHVYNFAC